MLTLTGSSAKNFMCIILLHLLIHSNTYLLSINYVPDTVLGTAVNKQTPIPKLELEELMFARGWERETDG